MFNMLTCYIHYFFQCEVVVYFYSVCTFLSSEKYKNNLKMNFWLNHIPEKEEFGYVAKELLYKLNGHSYVVLKYVVAKQIQYKQKLYDFWKRFLFYLPRKVIILIYVVEKHNIYVLGLFLFKNKYIYKKKCYL